MISFSEKERKLCECQFRIRMGCIIESFGYSEKQTWTSVVGHCCVPRVPGSVVKESKSVMTNAFMVKFGSPLQAVASNEKSYLW